ncbi:MAG TPA: hypothetical protein VKZ79_01400 [Alphaproteobacteria bacterium]|nr:hypothetical protein [Alphaproteobacteria bacterium]
MLLEEVVTPFALLEVEVESVQPLVQLVIGKVSIPATTTSSCSAVNWGAEIAPPAQTAGAAHTEEARAANNNLLMSSSLNLRFLESHSYPRRIGWILKYFVLLLCNN